jgi:cytochrome c5
MRHSLCWSGAVLIGLGIASAGPIRAQGTLPQGEGRDIVATACSQCHALTPILAVREGAAGWRRHVYNMVLRGAQLRPSEAETVIAYLSANLGPTAPVATRIALPDGPGKQLIEMRCTACHDLERIATIKRNKQDWPGIVANMIGRGAVASVEEVQAISAYLVENFGSD